MKCWSLLIGTALLCPTAHASPLSLEQYLEQVRSQNPEAQSLAGQVERAERALNEAETPFSAEAYADYMAFDDRNEPVNPFSPTQTKSTNWRLGVRDQSTFGLSTDVYITSTHTRLLGVNPVFFPLSDYHDASAGVDLTLSLWRNSFGAATRADVRAKKSLSRTEMLRRRFELKNLMLRAENAYWHLVSLNLIVKLQEENSDRAKKLRDWMRRRVRLNLADDVEGLQAQASLETRELELQSSLDERTSAARLFNSLRGQASESVPELAQLPAADALLKATEKSSRRMSREDFAVVYESALAQENQARASLSRLGAQLDLVAGVAANGLDQSQSAARGELEDLAHPTIKVGIKFSFPLDFSLIGDMKHSYKASVRASKDLKQHAKFAEERAWADILAQKTEAQRRFERSLSLEKVQTELVSRERRRLLNGRTTTFQAITMEQNLAVAQIQRVRAQLGLLQIENVLKTWEAQP